MSRLWQSVVSLWTWLVLVVCVVLWLPLMAVVRLVTAPFDRGRYAVGYLFRHIARVTATLNPLWKFRTAGRMRSVAWAVSLGLVLGGALGNLGDRIFRDPGFLRGRVVDWISVFGPNGEHWPIFNLADSAIVCGAVLAAVTSVLGIDLDGRRNTRA